MPPAIPLIAAAAAIAAPLVVGAFVSSAVAVAVISAVISIGIGFLAQALTPDDDFGPIAPDFAVEASRRTATLRTSIGTRKIVVGEAKIGGVLSFYEATGDNQYHHMVVALCEGPIEAIKTVWLNDTPVHVDDLDGNGDVVSGHTFYSGTAKVRIKKHLGETTQTVDTDLDTATTINTNFRGRGIAYLYVRIDWDRDLFPTGLPNISAEVKGAKFYDPRTAATAWTNNPAVILRGYLANAEWGYGEATANIDDTYHDAAANTCDEFVTVVDDAMAATAVDASGDTITFANDTILEYQTGDRVQLTTTGRRPAGLSLATDYYVIVHQRRGDPIIQLATSYANALAETQIDIRNAGTGTHTVTKKAEPRFTCNGVIDTAKESGVIIDDLKRSMGGYAIPAGGTWRIHAAKYETPTVTLNDDDFVGRVTIDTRHSRRDRFNRVRGTYVSPINDWQPTDFPPVVSSTYLTNDNSEELWRAMDLPYTTRPQTAQRLAKIALERHRQEITVKALFNLRALQIQAGDSVQVTNAGMAWTVKVFEVIGWKLAVIKDHAGEQALAVELTLRETASAIYSFTSATEETQVDPAPNTNLPSPFDVTAPTSVAVSTQEYLTDNGTRISQILVEWTKPANYLITQRGRIDVMFKPSLESTWQTAALVDGDETEALTPPVERDTNYDVRVRSVSPFGPTSGTSAWQRVSNYTVGAPGAGARSQLDYGLITEAPPSEVIERGSIGTTATKTLDYETIA